MIILSGHKATEPEPETEGWCAKFKKFSREGDWIFRKEKVETIGSIIYVLPTMINDWYLSTSVDFGYGFHCIVKNPQASLIIRLAKKNLFDGTGFDQGIGTVEFDLILNTILKSHWLKLTQWSSLKELRVLQVVTIITMSVSEWELVSIKIQSKTKSRIN